MSIRKQIQALHNRQEKAAHEYQRATREIKALQELCPHTDTTAMADPLGSKDRYNTCNECGKVWYS